MKSLRTTGSENMNFQTLGERRLVKPHNTNVICNRNIKLRVQAVEKFSLLSHFVIRRLLTPTIHTEMVTSAPPRFNSYVTHC